MPRGLPRRHGAPGPTPPGVDVVDYPDRGHVVPGVVARCELGGLVLHKTSVGPLDNNAYLLSAPDGAQLLVDAAAEPDRLLALVGLGATHGALDWIVTTHRHPDHTGALLELAAGTGARTAAGAEDADALPLAPDRRLRDGDAIELGGVAVEVIALRGHTPGSIALLCRGSANGTPHLMTGDALFPGGVGNTHGSAADFEQLMTDVERRVFDRLPDATVVHPGHGDDTTLGAERPHLAEWRARGW